MLNDDTLGTVWRCDFIRTNCILHQDYASFNFSESIRFIQENCYFYLRLHGRYAGLLCPSYYYQDSHLLTDPWVLGYQCPENLCRRRHSFHCRHYHECCERLNIVSITGSFNMVFTDDRPQKDWNLCSSGSRRNGRYHKHYSTSFNFKFGENGFHNFRYPIQVIGVRCSNLKKSSNRWPVGLTPLAQCCRNRHRNNLRLFPFSKHILCHPQK
jgi:hypothetical protein